MIEKPLRASRDGIVICPWIRDVAGAQITGHFVGTDNFSYISGFLDFGE